jgi:hypothetical protein
VSILCPGLVPLRTPQFQNLDLPRTVHSRILTRTPGLTRPGHVRLRGVLDLKVTWHMNTGGMRYFLQIRMSPACVRGWGNQLWMGLMHHQQQGDHDAG